MRKRKKTTERKKILTFLIFLAFLLQTAQIDTFSIAPMQAEEIRTAAAKDAPEEEPVPQEPKGESGQDKDTEIKAEESMIDDIEVREASSRDVPNDPAEKIESVTDPPSDESLPVSKPVAPDKNTLLSPADPTDTESSEDDSQEEKTPTDQQEVVSGPLNTTSEIAKNDNVDAGSAPQDISQDEKDADPIFRLDGKTAITTRPVEKEVTYRAPQNNKVTIRFLRLPERPGKMTIKEIGLSEKQKDDLHTSTGTAYDITSDMEDGSFEYILTLPTPKNSANKEIRYAESADGLDHAKKVPDDDVDFKDNKAEIRLDHFTVFVVATYSDVTLTVEKSTYAQKETVYAKAAELVNDPDKFYRIDLIEPGDTVLHNIAGCSNGISELAGSYLLPDSPPTGTWKAEIKEFSSSSDCNNGTNRTDSSNPETFLVFIDDISPYSPTVQSPSSGSHVGSSAPQIETTFTDNWNLDTARYNFDGGPWNTIFSGIGSSSTTSTFQNQSVWDTLSDGLHSLYFFVADDAGNTFETLSDSDFMLSKDTSSPVVYVNPPFAPTVERLSSYDDAGAFALDDPYGLLPPDAITTDNPVNTSLVGTYTVTYTATDSAGNVGSATRTVKVVDTTKPILSLLTAVPDPTNDNSPDFSFSSTEGGSIYYSGNCLSSTSTATPGANTVTFQPLPNGLHTSCTITVKDASGNTSDYLEVPDFRVDTIPPTVDYDASNPASGLFASDADQTFKVVSSGTDMSSCQFHLSPAFSPQAMTILPSGSSVSGAISLSSIPDGTYDYYVRCQDLAGNSTTLETRTITIDTTDPVVDTGPDGSYADTFFKEATATDSGSGIGSYLWSKISGPGDITFQTPSEEDTQISVNLEGQYVIRLTVTDRAGNAFSDDFTLTYDRTNPTLSLLGDNPMVIRQGQIFVDPGAIATDDTDSSIIFRISITGADLVNTSIVKDYPVNYSVEDAAGNPSGSSGHAIHFPAPAAGWSSGIQFENELGEIFYLAVSPSNNDEVYVMADDASDGLYVGFYDSTVYNKLYKYIDGTWVQQFRAGSIDSNPLSGKSSEVNNYLAKNFKLASSLKFYEEGPHMRTVYISGGSMDFSSAYGNIGVINDGQNISVYLSSSNPNKKGLTRIVRVVASKNKSGDHHGHNEDDNDDKDDGGESLPFVETASANNQTSVMGAQIQTGSPSPDQVKNPEVLGDKDQTKVTEDNIMAWWIWIIIFAIIGPIFWIFFKKRHREEDQKPRQDQPQ